MISDHPSTDELLAFALGLCDPASVEAIAAHLEECERCAEQFDDLATGTDPFVSALRDAFHPARTQETQATPPDSEPGVTRPPDSPGTPEIGSRFGRYEVKGLLGRGQMGAVYRAHDPRLARDIALKVQNCDLSAGPAELSRVENEARSAAQLKHPNIVQVYDQGIHEGRPFCAMELVEGQDLGYYSRERNLSEQEIASLLETLARAVDHAHHCGVIHRDLKPANVMIACGETVRREWRVDSGEPRIENRRRKTGRGKPTAEGSGSGTFAVAATADVPKITDFGLAKRIDVDGTETVAGSILGSPSYMPPEQAQGETSQIGPLSDVFSLGAILYELLTGRPPYLCDGQIQTLDAARRCECEPPSRVRPNVNRDLETICRKCLREEPEERYSSAAALADDLGRFLDGKPIHARRATVWERGVKLVRRHPVRTVGSLLLVACVVAFVATVGVMQYTKRKMIERQQWKNYAAQLSQCQGLAQSEPDQALELLRDDTRCPVRLRDFTWRWLSRLCRRRERSYVPPGGDGYYARGLAVRGDRFLVGGQDGSVALYMVGCAQPAWVEHKHGKAVTAVRFAPSGDFAVSAGEDGTVQRYELESDESRELIRVENSSVNDVILSSDGRWLATAHRHDREDGDSDGVDSDGPKSDGPKSDGVVRLWDLAGGNQLAASRPIKGSFRCIEFGSDCRTLFAGGDCKDKDGKSRGTIYVFRIDEGKDVRTEKTPRDGTDTGPAKSKEVDIVLVKRWHGHDSPLTALVMSDASSESPCLVSADESGKVLRRLLSKDALGPDEMGPEPIPVPTEGNDMVSSMDFSPDGKRLAVGSYNGTVELPGLASGQNKLPVCGSSSRQISAVAYVDANRLIAADQGGHIGLYRLSGHHMMEMKGHTRPITGVAFSGDGSRIVSSSDDGTIRIWKIGGKLTSEAIEAPVVLHPESGGWIRHMAVSQGTRLVWEQNGNVYCGPLGPTGVNTFVQLESQVSSVVFDLAVARDGSLSGVLGMGCEGPCFWHLPSKNSEALDVPDELGECSKLALSNKGRWLALAFGHNVHLFKLDPQTVEVLAKHRIDVSKSDLDLDSDSDSDLVSNPNPNPNSDSELVTSLVFSGDAKRLAVGTSDCRVILIDVCDCGIFNWSGRPRIHAECKGHRGGVVSLAFSPDGKTLAGGGDDGKITLWMTAGGDQCCRIDSGHREIYDLAFAPDGSLLASGGLDGVVRLWVAAQTSDEP